MPAIESSSPKAPNTPSATVATWDGKKLKCKRGVPGTQFANRNGAVKIQDYSANGSYHVGRVPPGSYDDRSTGARFLRDREKRSGFRIFSERKLLSVGHDTHDLDRHTVAVFKIASNSTLRVEEPPGELLIHNGNRWGLCSVGKAHIAPREQRCSGGCGYSVRYVGVIEEYSKCFVSRPKIRTSLRENSRDHCVAGKAAWYSRSLLRPLPGSARSFPIAGAENDRRHRRICGLAQIELCK